MKIPCKTKNVADMPAGSERLYDLESDPFETAPVEDETVKNRLKAALTRLLKENDAPGELYECCRLTKD